MVTLHRSFEGCCMFLVVAYHPLLTGFFPSSGGGGSDVHVYYSTRQVNLPQPSSKFGFSNRYCHPSMIHICQADLSSLLCSGDSGHSVPVIRSRNRDRPNENKTVTPVLLCNKLKVLQSSSVRVLCAETSGFDSGRKFSTPSRVFDRVRRRVSVREAPGRTAGGKEGQGREY